MLRLNLKLMLTPMLRLILRLMPTLDMDTDTFLMDTVDTTHTLPSSPTNNIVT